MRRTEASTPLTLFVNFVCSSAKRTPTEAVQAASSKCSASLNENPGRHSSPKVTLISM